MKNSRVIIYKDKEDETEIAIKVHIKEAIKWGGFGMCDLCGLVDEELYMCPELGHKALCKKCFKEHKGIVKWYIEDLHFVFNTLIQYVLNYKLNWNDEDLDLIDEFFASKGHMSLHIRKFIEDQNSEPLEVKDSIGTFWDDIFKDLLKGLEDGKETR